MQTVQTIWVLCLLMASCLPWQGNQHRGSSNHLIEVLLESNLGSGLCPASQPLAWDHSSLGESSTPIARDSSDGKENRRGEPIPLDGVPVTLEGSEDLLKFEDLRDGSYSHPERIDTLWLGRCLYGQHRLHVFSTAPKTAHFVFGGCRWHDVLQKRLI